MLSSTTLQGLTIFLGVTAWALNLTLIPLLLFRSKYELGSYKTIMISFSVVNMLHYAVDFFTLPSFFIHNQMAIIYAAGLSGQSAFWGTATVIAESVLFFTMTLIECMHFVYRYVVLCNQQYTWLLVFPYLHIIGTILILCNISYHATNFYFLLLPDEETRVFIGNITIESINRSSEEMFGLSTMYFSSETGMMRWKNVIGIANLLSSQFLLFGIMLFCGVRIVYELTSIQIRSNRRRFLHLQLFKALLAQTLNPILLLHLPCAALVILPMFRITLNENAEYLMFAILLYPILEPLIVVYFVVDRKRALLDCLNPARTDSWRVFPISKPSNQTSSSPNISIPLSQF